MTSVPGCAFNLFNLLQIGTYRVWVELTGQATTSFALTLSTDLTGALTAGTPLPVSLTVPGHMALLTFTATAGQYAALHLSSVSTTPSGRAMSMYVYNPSGGLAAQTSTTTKATLNLTNLVAGTYSVAVIPSDAPT